MHFAITSIPIDIETLKMKLAAEGAGACVCFEGWIRDHNDGRPVVGLEYEAHETIAVKEGERILREALERFAIISVSCEHRVGKLDVGECAVWVGVTAAHRGDAFEACRYIIDEIKSRLPIWKKEHYRDGRAGWVNCVTGAVETPLAAEHSS